MELKRKPKFQFKTISSQFRRICAKFEPEIRKDSIKKKLKISRKKFEEARCDVCL
jgi:hypothetical protein